MGDMADFANDYQESTMDEYYGYSLGLISIPDFDQLPELGGPLDIASVSYASRLSELDVGIRGIESSVNRTSYTRIATRLNTKAQANLYKPYPTCNCCESLMQPREGRYGKFYYCPNYCKDQKTVSDTYWQSVRQHK